VSIRWVTVFLDFPGDRFDAGVAFWQRVTGYGLSPARGASGEFATLLPPSGDAYLRVQRISGGPGGCHLDLHVDAAAESLAAAAARAEAAGARIGHREDGLVVAASPGGFPFCLTRWAGERAVPPPLDGPGGPSRVDTLCLDVPAGDFEAERAFWAGLTGREARDARVPGFAYLTRPEHWAVRLLVQRRQATAPGERAGGHVDIGCADPDEPARHASRGARVIAEQPHWTVLADPASRAYCLVRREPAAGAPGDG
jgi:Glyoxalase-like domain